MLFYPTLTYAAEFVKYQERRENSAKRFRFVFIILNTHGDPLW